MDLAASLHRRQFLQSSSLAATLPAFLGLRDQANASGSRPPAKSCILLFCWGGMSHLETWDPKPLAPAEYRGEFQPIATNVPGIHIGEHMPALAGCVDRLAIVRSMHHRSIAHGLGMYWNWTGFPAPQAETPINVPPTRQDRPSLGPMISKFRRAPAGFPSVVQLPYPMVDNSTLQAGENAGFLGQASDQVICRTSRGRLYGGVSRDLGAMVVRPAGDVDQARLDGRRRLADAFYPASPAPAVRSFERFRHMAHDMLGSPRVQSAFSLDSEPAQVREAYGDHICGQSMLQARRLVEAGVPVVNVICSAGDLNGAAGDHWDTHGDNFNRLKRDLLPPFDRGASALLHDLRDRGLLDETLVVIFTEFGRTPRISNNGRDHYPRVYSIALAGGGIRGGQVYGQSDRIGAFPRDNPVGPNDLHATIFTALGIPLAAQIHDADGRPHPLCTGRPLPLF